MVLSGLELRTRCEEGAGAARACGWEHGLRVPFTRGVQSDLAPEA